MAELLQEYELSIWDDIDNGNATSSSVGTFSEEKVVVIGSNKLHTPTKAYNVTLKESVNGEKTLTFSLPRVYRDRNGELVDNPFLSLLTVERKLKLRDGPEYNYFDDNGNYNKNYPLQEDLEDRWTDYVIKTIDEDKESYVNNYTCKEVYVNELAKNGWSVVLDTELKNNYGTLTELGNRILEGSGWTAEGVNPPEKITEPLFWAELKNSVSATKIAGDNNGKSATLSKYIYTFYSQLAESNGKWKAKSNLTSVQVMYNNGEFFQENQLDENRQVVDDYDEYNYLISRSKIADLEWYSTGIEISSVAMQGGRVVQSVQSHFEPVADKYVDDYYIKSEMFKKVGLPQSVLDEYSTNPADYKVYHYVDTEYITSDIVQNYVANATGYTSLAFSGLRNQPPSYAKLLKITSLLLLDSQPVSEV